MKCSFLAIVALSLLSGWLSAQPAHLPYVNPFIGTDAHGHTYPGATAPFGMVQLSPDTRTSPADWDGCSGYHASDSLIYGFSHTHLSGTGVSDYCDVLFMPFTGKPYLQIQDNASSFRKANEKAEAGYYSVLLDKDHIKVELTATERVGVHRYTFPPNTVNGHVMIDLRHRDEVLTSSLKMVGDHEIEGSRISKSWAKEQHVYFVARFSQPFSNSRVLDLSKSIDARESDASGTAIVGLLDFHLTKQPVVITVGLSAVSVDAARRNLEAECNHFAFDRVKAETQSKWESKLSAIDVEGGTIAQKTAFYTALYHTMIVPNVWSDVDGQYRGRDLLVHQAKGHQVYSVFSLWDTYRACDPLYALLDPARTNDFIQTFLRQYEQGGLLPVWELAANETDCMIGNHAIPVIADAYIKGIRGFNAEEALEAMQKSANSNRYGLPYYRDLGFIPSDKEPESVSKTLEYAFDDWCIARMANEMGRQDVYNRFISRAQSWKNLFDPSTGFFRGKNNAAWYAPFDPFEVNFNYTEANAWQYRFAAPQDIGGMMQALGGRSAFSARLDSLFSAHPKTTGRDQADITGLIGQYAHGNEPSHHMAYLYNFTGQPWKTQERVRQIMDNLYSDKNDGLSGNEDCGQMSAWLVFSAMGFYPVVPGSGYYVIGTPMFDKATVRLSDDKFFTIWAQGTSGQKKYIQKATWNDAPFTKSWFTHAQLTGGGTLRLTMGDRPSSWATQMTDCPESSISEAPIVPAPFVSKGDRVFQKKQQIELGCLDRAAKIYYTLDGTSPTTQSATYQKPLEIERETELRFFAQQHDKRSAEMKASFTRMQEGVSVMRYNTRFDHQYTGRGDNGLVDMLRGGADFRSGGWQGYSGVNLDVVLDLGKPRAIQKITAGFLQDENSWIFFPSKVMVEVSDDGMTFKPAGSISNDVLPTEKGALLKDFILNLTGIQARYVHVTGVSLGKCPPGHKGAGNPCWTFADEILIE
jgi:predicted alpha-1,2-mannosidase